MSLIPQRVDKSKPGNNQHGIVKSDVSNTVDLQTEHNLEHLKQLTIATLAPVLHPEAGFEVYGRVPWAAVLTVSDTQIPGGEA